ncbi:MAG: acyl-CoA dehydrogenase family protein, partial [bacterium]|nr:acyl-CoA dehydrogenase family protein [bacterium]
IAHHAWMSRRHARIAAGGAARSRPLRPDLPGAYGGLGVDSTVDHRPGRGGISRPVQASCHADGAQHVGSYPVALFGTDDVKQRFLPRMAAGEIATRSAWPRPAPGPTLLRWQRRPGATGTTTS